MKCIYCSGKTKTTNSRPSKASPAVWRRKQCLSCLAVFTTRETPDLGLSLRLEDANGALQPFSRDRLLFDLQSSLSHRKTALSDASDLTDTVIGKLLAHSRGGVIKRTTVIEQSLSVMKRFDTAGAVHYRAHHQA